MILEMKVPSPGESIKEVEIAAWLVQDGDYVEKDQAIAEVDSDKATLELPAEASGIITLKAEEGDAVAVGAIVCLIDTPGAFPGLEAEERGQGEAIARNIRDMFMLKVPVICIIIGEGASGGAMGIGVGDRVYMMANTWYTVISPESCSSILWRSWDHKEKAADELKLTSDHMLGFGLVDGVIPEPLGGAHWNHNEAAELLKKQIISAIEELKNIDPELRIDQRIDKFSSMGRWEEQSTQVS